MTVKGIPTFLEGRNAETFKHCSMSVDFERLNTSPRVKSQENKPCYVIASTDVKLLCETFLIQHIVISGVFQHYVFRITIHRMFDDMLSKIPAEKSPQRRLLEPFTVLYGIPHFRIAGPANTEYCAGIVAQVSRIGPTIGEYFNQVIELRDKGHENLSRNDVKGAIKSYKMAYSLLISRCLRRNVVGPDWTGFYSGLQGAVVDMYLALAANLAFSHFSLDEWGDANFWACDATRWGPRRGTLQRENWYAKLVYLKAIASARLGKKPQAVEELCEGLKPVPRESYKDKKLIAMRREARFQIKGLGGIRVLKAMGIGHL